MELPDIVFFLASGEVTNVSDRTRTLIIRSGRTLMQASYTGDIRLAISREKRQTLVIVGDVGGDMWKTRRYIRGMKRTFPMLRILDLSCVQSDAVQLRMYAEAEILTGAPLRSE